MPAKTKGVEQPSEDTSRPLFESSRKVLLAAIGAMALAQDEIEEFITRLVDRGEIADREGRQLLHEIIERRKKNSSKMEDEFTKRIETILTRLNVPTKADIEALGNKIATLSKKVDELKKSSQSS